MRIASLLALAILLPAFAHATVIITEIMYDVPTSVGADDTREWIEIANTGSSAVDLTGWKFNDGANHILNVPPANGGTGSLVLSAGGVAILADNATTFLNNLYPDFSGTVIDTTMSLNNTSATLALVDTSGAIENNISYAKTMGAAGDGNTLQWNGSAFASAVPTPGTYAGVSPPTDDSTPPDATSTTAITPTSGGGPAEYLPIPMLRILGGGDRTVSSGADTAFTAAVYDGKGNKRDDAVVAWSFGDGMRRTGASVFHAYYNSGEYIAVVRATTSDGGDALDDMVVTVQDAGIRITSISSRGITLANNDSRTLDLSLWRLSMGGQEFKIPEDTQILAGRTILFPSQVIELPIADSASLLYPSGEVAATYPVVTTVLEKTILQQPSSGTVSYKKVSEVEPILNASANTQAHENAVGAPAVAMELAAAGAALPSSPLADQPRAGGLFRSPWFLGLLGVIALAGSAFIFL